MPTTTLPDGSLYDAPRIQRLEVIEHRKGASLVVQVEDRVWSGLPWMGAVPMPSTGAIEYEDAARAHADLAAMQSEIASGGYPAVIVQMVRAGKKQSGQPNVSGWPVAVIALGVVLYLIYSTLRHG